MGRRPGGQGPAGVNELGLQEPGGKASGQNLPGLPPELHETNLDSSAGFFPPELDTVLAVRQSQSLSVLVRGTSHTHFVFQFSHNDFLLKGLKVLGQRGASLKREREQEEAGL